jgi:hypothetical protein
MKGEGKDKEGKVKRKEREKNKYISKEEDSRMDK